MTLKKFYKKNSNKMAGRTLAIVTTTKEALRNWKEKTNQDPGEATHISLEFQRPPMVKIGAPIKKLVNCTVLSMACNMIERPTMPPNLKNLRVLNLSRNNLRSLCGVQYLANTLEELWVSYNLISRLVPIESMKALKIFYVSHNNIKDWKEIKCLAVPKALKDISFMGNPLQQSMNEDRFRREMAKRLPNLEKLDFVPIFKKEAEDTKTNKL